MLPILRTISVGGVFLAITILGLALIPPGSPHMRSAATDAPARGALIDQHEHPEWRHFLLLAAVRRAEELDRLRGLPDTPTLPEIPFVAPDIAPAQQSPDHPNAEVAGLPSIHYDTNAEDVTGSVNVAPSATLPIDIGETSSFELPVVPTEERPPVARFPLVNMPASDAQEANELQGSVGTPISKISAIPAPEQVRPVVVIRKRSVRHRASQAQASVPAQVQTQMPPPFNLIQALFAALAGKPMPIAPPAGKPANSSQSRAKPKQQAAIRVGAQ